MHPDIFVGGGWDQQPDAALCGALAWSTRPGQPALPSLFSLPIALPSFSTFCYTEDTNHSCDSLKAPPNHEGLLQEHSSFTLPKASYPDCNLPPPFQWRIFLFSSQANKAHLQSTGSSSCHFPRDISTTNIFHLVLINHNESAEITPIPTIPPSPRVPADVQRRDQQQGTANHRSVILTSLVCSAFNCLRYKEGIKETNLFGEYSSLLRR